MSLSSGVAFFPWLSLAESRCIGPIRLLPFGKGESPGDLPYLKQRDLEAVLYPYVARPQRRISSAVLIEVDDWSLGQPIDFAVERLFAAKEALAFSGLATRRLFEGHFYYCCYESFSLVVQRYIPGKGEHFAYYTRRRDGGSQQVWSSNDFMFHPPLQVTAPTSLPALDEALVALLMRNSLPRAWYDAVYAFNHSNTDSADIPEHVEMVMLKSAFEQLLDISQSAAEFQRVLTSILPDPESPFPAGVLTDRWQRKFPGAERLLDAWAREFCARRGAAAHGARPDDSSFIWTERAHLAYASILFPLLFKRLAARHYGYQMSAYDLARLANIDAYIAEEPFATVGEDEALGDTQPVWIRIESNLRMREISTHIRGGLDERYGSNLGEEEP